MIRSNTARLFVENFNARLPGIVICTDDPYFEFFLPGDLEIAQKSQHPQNTCSKNPGACFFRKKKAPAAGT